MSLPSVLFKYLTINRAVEVLSTKSIRFTQPQYFNDPFECLPSVDIDWAKEIFIELDHNKKKLEQGVDKKIVLKKLGEFISGVVSICEEDYQSIGALSLSEKCDVPLMWSHYAGEHTGVVLGIKTEDSLLLPHPNTQEPRKYCDIGSVTYGDKRFSYPNPEGDHLGFMFHKDKCWQYEKEWRVIKGLEILDQVDEEIYVSQFNASSIGAVIFGALTSSEDITKIKDILSANGYKGVGCYQAQLSSDEYDLDITTLIGAILDNDDIQMEAYGNPVANHLYKTISKGKLFKAMEIIDENTVFQKEKDFIDFLSDD